MGRKNTELHGGNIYKIFRERNMVNILDYSSNINPYGIPETLKRSILENIHILECYPDPDYVMLREKIAAKYKLDMKNIILGNGATEVISLFMKKIRAERILVVSPTFAEYERGIKIAWKGYGDCESKIEGQRLEIEYFKLSEEEEFTLNVEMLISELDKGYDLVIICNPNNPTGKFICLENMEKILEKCIKTDTKLFVDEAFIEFVKDGMKESIINSRQDKKKLFVIRSLTKFFAIPGLRLGYGICFDEELSSRIEETKEMWSVNSFAELAGLTVFEDREYIEKTEEWIEKEKKYMYESLLEIEGLNPYRTYVNFILVKIKGEIVEKGLDVGELKEKMLDKGILIRDASNFKCLDRSYFRLAIRARGDNDKVIGALSDILKDYYGK